MRPALAAVLVVALQCSCTAVETTRVREVRRSKQLVEQGEVQAATTYNATVRSFSDEWFVRIEVGDTCHERKSWTEEDVLVETRSVDGGEVALDLSVAAVAFALGGYLVADAVEANDARREAGEAAARAGVDFDSSEIDAEIAERAVLGSLGLVAGSVLTGNVIGSLAVAGNDSTRPAGSPRYVTGDWTTRKCNWRRAANVPFRLLNDGTEFFVGATDEDGEARVHKRGMVEGEVRVEVIEQSP